MSTEVQLAVAGSGKTAEIARRITAQGLETRSIALTFTVNGQQEISSRVGVKTSGEHETMGWFTFLVRHIVRPYLPAVFPGIYATGLCYVDTDSDIPRGRSDWQYYFNDSHQPYNTRLALLAKKVLVATSDLPIRRLEGIFDQIYIDEFQDLGGNDLVVLETLMNSSIGLFATGDVRQSVLQTSRSDRLNREYRGVHLVEWFREKENQEICSITYSDETSRFNQAIASFSDLIHDPELNLPATTSVQEDETGHDGVFLVDTADIPNYVATWNPTILWSRKSQRELPSAELMTFGSSKGLTRERVLIVATGPIGKWLKTKDLLAASSACGFYVAATRARFSVAIAVDRASRVHGMLHPDFAGNVKLWTPPEE
ncbi:hypothetical protein OK351_17405 [Glutamicibacter sp. MNS18]|uniref:hypothetical protein n=1 Tax=Glutamicibacter sp. MNS18 TaxID=2989817 RepID=UPI002236275B|nr:hypothetical protein [Glutamicibacter sp. MNS18]MCW4467260.1 hypothetical protein [Glutamicibacter sp. MNS18]